MSLSSAFKRVEVCTFAREWLALDAYKQCPYELAPIIAAHLQGKTKPIFYKNRGDIGNHVVVFNSRFIALHSDDWRRKLFRYFTGYARGKRKDVAWLMHYTRPQYIVRRAVSDRIPSGYSKKILAMRRLHVYEDHLIPEEIKGNLSGQIRQILPVPKKITEYCKEEVNRVPLLFKWPQNEFFTK